MNLILKFKNIIDNPNCKIIVNEKELYSGIVYSEFDFQTTVEDLVTLNIVHWGKSPEDTIVDNDNNIVRDRSFEIEKIIIDGYDIENLIWKSQYIIDDKTKIESCLFFGPNGRFEIKFQLPILKWILENTMPDNSWKEDYEYYIRALKILENIE